MDPVSDYLHRRGLPVQPEYFLASDYLLGYRLDQPHYQLTYRLDGPRLILCDVRAATPAGQTLSSLRTLLHRIMAEVDAVQSVDALIYVDEPDPVLAQQRQRLVRLMQAEGARAVEIDGEHWLRIDCHQAPGNA